MLNSNAIDESDVKFFIGYSGWAVAQLNEEIEDNTWIVSDKYHHDVIFSADEEELWRAVIINLGNKYAHVSNFPIDPSLN